MNPHRGRRNLSNARKAGCRFCFSWGTCFCLLSSRSLGDLCASHLAIVTRQKTEALLENLEAVQESLDDYSERFNSFPENIDQLINEGFIDGFGKNPYHERLMKPRHVGQSFAGDFTYIPIYDSRGQVMSYVLVGYGGNLKKGKDIFTKGHDYSRLTQFYPDPDGIPDGVVIILEGKRGTHRV